MRALAIKALSQAADKRGVGRVPYVAHALSLGRIVEDAMNDTGELIGDEPLLLRGAYLFARG